MSRHTTTGNAKPWEVARGYQHTSRHSSRWERPEGEPSLGQGALIVLGGFMIIATIGALL